MDLSSELESFKLTSSLDLSVISVSKLTAQYSTKYILIHEKYWVVLIFLFFCDLSILEWQILRIYLPYKSLRAFALIQLWELSFSWWQHNGTWPLLPTRVSNVIEMSVGELKEEHNHQEKYFQFYENKRWLTAQTFPLRVEPPFTFYWIPNLKRWQCQYCKDFFLNSTYRQSPVRSRGGNMDPAEHGFLWEN